MTIALGTELALFAVTAFMSASLALMVLTAINLRGRADRRSMLGVTDDETVFLFDDGDLVDATSRARKLLASAPAGESDLARLMSLLGPRFPDLCDVIEHLPETGQVTRSAGDDSLRLSAELRGEMIRLTLVDTSTTDQRADIDRQTLDAMGREMVSLRAISDNAPFLVWRQAPDGCITWVNRTYLDLAERSREPGERDSWPPPTLFKLQNNAPIQPGTGRRIKLRETGSGRTDWYQVHAAPLDDDTLFTAIDCNATVVAENKLRAFMQTLTETFGHLTIGLAVFDRSRQLALFNPALTDLTGLPIDFLTARPSLFGFLDKLRDRHMIPEPKDYTGWRRRIVELEAAAADGSYCETWSLPHGQTYRVTGRPHPDGAVAFLFENISTEISLTRQFRSELEIGQGALDSFEDGVAVFNSSGLMVMSNVAYCVLWDADPETSLANSSVTDATRIWMERTAPTPVWGDLRDFVLRSRDRDEWSADVRLKDGRALACRFIPIAGGATLVRFAVVTSEGQTAEPVAQRA